MKYFLGPLMFGSILVVLSVAAGVPKPEEIGLTKPLLWLAAWVAVVIGGIALFGFLKLRAMASKGAREAADKAPGNEPETPAGP